MRRVTIHAVRCAVLCALTFFLAPAPRVCATPAERLVVRDLVGKKVDQDTADVFTSLLIGALEGTGRYQIYSRAEIQAVLEQLGQTQKLGKECDTEKCILDFGAAMGADLVLSGEVGKLGSRYVVTLSLYQITVGERRSRRTFECSCSEDEMADRIKGYALELMGVETPAQREAREAADRRAAAERAENGRRAREAADQSARQAREESERRDREARAAAEEAQRAKAAPAAPRPPSPAGGGPGEGGTGTSQSWREPTTGMEFVWIPGGEFDMGSNDGSSDEKPVHRVRVDGFWMCKSEVTQGQWKAVMGNNPSKFSGCGDDCPVEQVSWDDAQEYIRKLTSRSGKAVRLPSEAEWEYAARGGLAQQKWAGTNSGSDLEEYAWYDDKYSGSGTHPVCQKRQNVFGLCDMIGNVWEWVSDWKGGYSSGFQDNPAGPSSGSDRVFRGGSWDNRVARHVRAASRNGADRAGRGYNIGFRLVAPPGQQ